MAAGKVTPSGERRRFGGLLRQRNFALFWVGETVNQLGSAMALIGVPLLAVLFLRATVFQVGALAAMAYLPWLVIGLPAGAWVDRLPPCPVMIGCDLACAALYASVPVAYAAGALSIGQLLAVQLLAGAANVLFATAYQVNLPSLVTAAELTEGNTKLQASSSAATLGGRGLSGVVTQFIGATAALVFNAASFLVSAACLLAIGPAEPGAAGSRPAEPRRAARRQASTLRRDVIDGATLVSRDLYLRPLALFGGLANFALDAFAALVIVRPRTAARHGGAAVRAADPAGRPRAAAGVLCRRSPGRRDRGEHGQHHHGHLPPGLLPAGDARPGHRHDAVRHDGHQSFRCTGRGRAGDLARCPRRALGRAVGPRGRGHCTARPGFYPPSGASRRSGRLW